MNNVDKVNVARLLCFYGDDFTGSTDALEALAASGVETVLFLAPPPAELLAERFPGARCFGIAGVSRSITPEAMERELGPQLERLNSYGAAVVHYKICSTFDSSPQTGSIGKVLELGRRLFPGQRYIPLLAGVPLLKRYTVFGHHFAGAGGEGTYRLDRHPTMSRHPITPMSESDLRQHLALQTNLPVGLMDLTALDGAPEAVRERLEERANGSDDAILFDVLDEPRLETAGRLIWEEALRGGGGLFAIGSSGIEYALTAHWRAEGLIPREPVQWEAPGSVDRLLVVSGSCSPVTELQLQKALSQGYEGIKVPVQDWLGADKALRSKQELLERAVRLIRQGRSVILYTASGPQDPAIGKLREAFRHHGMENADSGRFIGTELGRLTKAILAQTDLTRILIAGGDTSGYVTRELGIYAMSCLSAIVPGGPLCRCYSEERRMNGLELSLKGGQVGGGDYFELVRQGGRR
ncbi:four-carbon acid sugar kinase family protein [Paenibacillus solisilvae]|uniref:Four-carbon acid sugar kinase family protein n=1 Tax=Paenibacillus solisilvae TaxID=2486751 RepID=A0ABW0WAW6_9BACL